MCTKMESTAMLLEYRTALATMGGRVKTICNMNYTISEFTSILYSTHITLYLY